MNTRDTYSYCSVVYIYLFSNILQYRAPSRYTRASSARHPKEKCWIVSARLTGTSRGTLSTKHGSSRRINRATHCKLSSLLEQCNVLRRREMKYKPQLMRLKLPNFPRTRCVTYALGWTLFKQEIHWTRTVFNKSIKR